MSETVREKKKTLMCMFSLSNFYSWFWVIFLGLLYLYKKIERKAIGRSGFWVLLEFVKVWIGKMFVGCECLCWSSRGGDVSDLYQSEPEPFSLPSPIPEWPQGQGFATGKICLGEIEVLKITKFERIWRCNTLRGKAKGVSFYRPVGIPDGFSTLGHYCQSNDQPLRGYVLVARDIKQEVGKNRLHGSGLPALKEPLDYTLVWSTDTNHDGCGYIWMPNPPDGYKAMGFVVTNEADEPPVDEVRCVRADLTETCETCETIFDTGLSFSNYTLRVWSTIPCRRGMFGKGVSIGTFFCSTYLTSEDELSIACLKNLDSTLHAMPNLNQIHAIIKHYGPTVFFHPDEVYLPSSVSWFFKNGALLCQNEKPEGEPVDCRGSNLPSGGKNDGEFWIDLPNDDDKRNNVKCGNIESAELYIHVKPAFGGTFTDIVMWVFCPFNGPSTIKVGVMSIAMNKIGQHIGDWEHFTLRVSNFTGELWGAYFSQHSGGKWTDASDLEYIGGNKPIIYSSKNGHASFPHPGTYLQGSSKLGIGIRNDVAQSKYFVDSSTRYQIIAAEYLGDGVVEEPCWLQYMREWGPTIVYDSRSELEKIIHLLPVFVRFSVENIFDLFPTELSGEEGPTGPKEKDNWFGDERC